MPPPFPIIVRSAIEIYLKCAYGDALPPTIRSRVEALNALGDDQFFRGPPFEINTPAAPTRYSLRLGNRLYPHMKLTLQLSPDSGTWLFKADTHDTHCCPPPTNREYGAFLHLMEANQKIAQAIESQWAEAGIPTFKTYLRDDLLRRQALAAGKSDGSGCSEN